MQCDILFVSHHNHRIPLAVNPLEQVHDVNRGFGIQVPGRFVGQDDGGIVNQCPCHSHPLPLSPAHLVGTVLHAVAQPHAEQCLFGPLQTFRLCYPRINQRHGHILQCRVSWQQVKGLKHKTNLLVPYFGQLLFVHVAHIGSVQHILPRSRRIQTPQNIHKSRFTRPRRTHYRHIVVAPYLQIDSRQSVYLLGPHFVGFVYAVNRDNLLSVFHGMRKRLITDAEKLFLQFRVEKEYQQPLQMCHHNVRLS